VLVTRGGEGARPVNACLFPLYAAEGASVTTVEGLGGGPRPPHPLQAALAAAHGSQCGFCTPGFVVAAAGALCARAAGRPPPSVADVEDLLAGNLCRCTGYRPIVDALRPWLEGGGEGVGCAPDRGGGGLAPAPAPLPPLPPVPPALASRPRAPLTLPGPVTDWCRPTTLAALAHLKRKNPAARLVGGATEVGIETSQKGVRVRLAVDPTAVPELARVEAGGAAAALGAATAVPLPAGAFLGAAVTLVTLQSACDDLAASRGAPARGLAAVGRQLRWFAGTAVRAAATLGGNVCTASPISDLNPIFVALGATMVVAEGGGGEGGGVKMSTIRAADFFVGYRATALTPPQLLVGVIVPWTVDNEYVLEFKVGRRREDDIAVVNACARVRFESCPDPPFWRPADAAVAFGGVADRTLLARATSAALAGAGAWGRGALDAALAALPSDVCLPADAPGGVAAYRLTLARSFLARFVASSHAGLAADAAAARALPPPPLDADLAAAAAGLPPRPPPSGLQYYDVSTDGAVIGAPAPHAAAGLHTTGRALYLADAPLPARALHAALALSTKPHAILLGVDTAAAAAVPGFVAFFGASDVPGSNALGPFAGDPLFADGVVLCVGHPLGIVVATSEVGARRAAAAVAGRYGDDLPSVVSIDEAIAATSFFPDPCGLSIERGDVDAALAAAAATPGAVVVSGEARSGGQDHFYLEPHAALATPGEGGEMVVLSSTQAPAGVQGDVAAALGAARARVTVKTKRVGGGFGGKETRANLVAAAAAVAAARLQTPVRLVLDRATDMAATGGRHPFLTRYTLAADAAGRLLAADWHFYSNGGCTPDLSTAVMQRALLHADNAYSAPALRAAGAVCRTNLPSNTAFRGFGAPQAMLAVEIGMDHLAAELGMAREEIRAINLYRSGDATHYGTLLADCAARACWDAVVASSGLQARQAGVAAFNAAHRWRKRGLAVTPTKFGASFTLKHYNQAGALVHVHAGDGSVRLAHGGVEMGQGLHTKMVAIAAAALGVPPSTITIVDTSTDVVANASPTAASVSSDLYGAAVRLACDELASRLAPHRERLGPGASFAAVAAAAHAARVDLTAHGFHKTPGVEGYGSASPFAYMCYGAAVAEVELDTLTGTHSIRRADVCMDAGAPVNPALDVGQVEGAFVQGAGWATIEDVIIGGPSHPWLPRGVIHTRGPGTYKVPTAADAPSDFRVALLRGARCGATPLTHSSKAVGEPPFFLGASVFFALRDAVSAARAHAGLGGHFVVHAPATAAALRMACGDELCAGGAVEGGAVSV